jgi:tetratricopeptide (TPR) repeat protein
MKKVLFSTILLLFSVVLYSQSAKVNTAYANYTHASEELRNNNLDKAVESLTEAVQNIEPAISDPKTSVKSKTWRYRGNIYSMVAGIETMRAAYPNAVMTAVESYAKAMELDPKGSYNDEVTTQLKILHDAEFINGNEAFGEQKFADAIGYYNNSISIFETLGLVDSVSYFNGALAADNGKMWDAALEKYMSAAEIGYQDVYCYNRAMIILKDQEKYDEALDISKKALAKYPDNNDLITTQLNVYLAADMYEEAETEMEQAAIDKPDDPTMWFALAVVKDNLGKVDDAEAAYKKSLELDKNYFNSNLNLAILYFNKASKMIEAANAIPAKEVDKYNNAIKAAKDQLKLAVPYFEAAYAERADRSILMDLKEAYGQLGDTANYKRVKEILDSE